ncbi:MAG TPA: hypothetical protein PL033_20040 [Candidatus Brocadiia bacterium]|nr:hypothetical protein [Candidatus Brocadiia bacterium]
MEKQPRRKRFDKSSAEARILIDEIVHGTFVKEGTMVAFPTCFPAVSVPIRADEGLITALDVSADGMLYGGTSGKQAHLFVGMFHGATGMIFDLGAPKDATESAAICCTKDSVAMCVNGPGGGRILTRKLHHLPFDLLQEWGFDRPPLNDLGAPAPGERIIHAVAIPDSNRIIGTTANRIFSADVNDGKIKSEAEIFSRGRIAVGSDGAVYGFGENAFWRFDAAAGKLALLQNEAVKLPPGEWDGFDLVWAADKRNGILYTADRDGNVFSFRPGTGFEGPLGKTRYAPVAAMAVTMDGRVFGFCGTGIMRMFCYDPSAREMRDVGIAISVLERRRYGYVFADAATGRDGEIYFAENDNLGHVWLYFPRIMPPR